MMQKHLNNFESHSVEYSTYLVSEFPREFCVDIDNEKEHTKTGFRTEFEAIDYAENYIKNLKRR